MVGAAKICNAKGPQAWRRFAVEGERLDGAVSDAEDGAAGGFVNAARFHADETVLDQIEAADAIVVAEAIEFGEERGG